MTELEPDFPEAGYPPVAGTALLSATTDTALVNAITRLAQAVEQNTAALLGRAIAPVAPTLAPLPPVQTQAQPVSASFDGCPIHQVPWKVVPAGVSKKNGKAYESFRACSVAGCDQRPRL